MAGKTTPSRTTKSSTSKTSNETSLVKELAKILNETDLSEIEMKKGDLKIRVSTHSGTVMQTMAAPVAGPATATSVAPTPSPASAVQESKTDASSHPGAVKSPMVGTAYVRPSPDADPFVKIGDKVKEGDTIVLVEAMKTFNPITAPKSGKIEQLLVDDAQPVEFGETLFIIV